MSVDSYPEFAEGVAIVSGGTGGIGEAIVRDLARSGSNVAFTYYSNTDAAETLLAEIKGLGVKAECIKLDTRDVEKTQAFIDDVVARYGKLHSVVNAAGPPLELGFISQITPAQWAKVMRADIEACYNFIWPALQHLKRQRSGSIVAMVTALVDRPPIKDILSAAPKAAVQALIRGIALEEGRFGVRANCVGPGFLDAGVGADILAEEKEGYVNLILPAIPMRRLGKAEEIAKAVTFLLSDRAQYITGTMIPVDGGFKL